MIALHIIQKTPSAPAFVFATFEQADNLLTTANGQTVPVEDADRNVINASRARRRLHALTCRRQPDRPAGRLSPPNAPFCNTSGPATLLPEPQRADGVPGGRQHLPQPARPRDPAADDGHGQRAAHAAIAAYSAANGIANSPWAYYKLVNVQAYPFSVTDIVSDPNSPRNAATFYQANIVVETNYTLQNFSGRVASNGATNYTAPAGAL